MPWIPDASPAGGLDTGGLDAGGEEAGGDDSGAALDTGLEGGGEDPGLDGGRLNGCGLLTPPGAALDPVGD